MLNSLDKTMDKQLLRNSNEWSSWKLDQNKKYDNANKWAEDEDCPNLYPCVVVSEYEPSYDGLTRGDLFYHFVYLTDFQYYG